MASNDYLFPGTVPIFTPAFLGRYQIIRILNCSLLMFCYFFRIEKEMLIAGRAFKSCWRFSHAITENYVSDDSNLF